MDSETGDYSVNSTMRQGLELAVGGSVVFPSGVEAFGDFAVGRVSSDRLGAAYAFQMGNDGTGWLGVGFANQTYAFEGTSEGGEAVALYEREVAAEDDVVLEDREATSEVLDVYSASGTGKVAEWAGPVGKGVSAKLAKLAESRGKAGMAGVFGM